MNQATCGSPPATLTLTRDQAADGSRESPHLRLSGEALALGGVGMEGTGDHQRHHKWDRTHECHVMLARAERLLPMSAPYYLTTDPR